MALRHGADVDIIHSTLDKFIPLLKLCDSYCSTKTTTQLNSNNNDNNTEPSQPTSTCTTSLVPETYGPIDRLSLGLVLLESKSLSPLIFVQAIHHSIITDLCRKYKTIDIITAMKKLLQLSTSHLKSVDGEIDNNSLVTSSTDSQDNEITNDILKSMKHHMGLAEYVLQASQALNLNFNCSSMLEESTKPLFDGHAIALVRIT